MPISTKVKRIAPSPTLGITAKAKQMKAEGIDVVSFGAGEPDFDTPEHIKAAAKKALDEGFTKYTPTSGIPDLKQAIIKKFKNDNGLEYTAGEIIVSCGAKHSLYNAVLTLCEEGDEVIVPSPYWVSYAEMIKMAGAKTVFIETSPETHFKITPQQLQKAVTPKTRLLLLNSPSNPTGMVYSRQELSAIAGILMEKNVICVSDEIYEKLVYDGVEHVSIASLDPKMKKLTVVVNGVSKAYSMTGWRIGYAAGEKEIIQAMSNLQDHSTSNPTSIAQVAAVAALEGSQEDLKKMAGEFKKRLEYMVSRVNSIPGLSVTKPEGAFYCFINVSGLLNKKFQGKPIGDSLNLSTVLLANAHVAVVPGSAFGDDRYVRLSYATSMANIAKGLDRIEKFAKEL